MRKTFCYAEKTSRRRLLLANVIMSGMRRSVLAFYVTEIVPPLKVALMSGYAKVDSLEVFDPHSIEIFHCHGTNKIREALDWN
jgi:hypothetical protein